MVEVLVVDFVKSIILAGFGGIARNLRGFNEAKRETPESKYEPKLLAKTLIASFLTGVLVQSMSIVSEAISGVPLPYEEAFLVFSGYGLSGVIEDVIGRFMEDHF